MASCRIREKQEGGKRLHKFKVLKRGDDLWDKVRGLGSESSWKGCK